MKAKNSSTLHRCSEFTKCPSEDMCHQVGPADGEQAARDEDDDERGEGQHAEHVDPGRDVRRLPVGQRLARAGPAR